MSTETGEKSVQDIVAELGIGDMNDKPMDPSELVEKLEAMSDAESETETDDKGANPPQSASSSAQTDAAKDGVQQQQTDGKQPPAGATSEPVGVLLKDGQHIIPYEKHKELRSRAETAESRAQASEARVKELEAALKSGKPASGEGEGAKQQQRSDAQTTLDDDLAMVEELESQAKVFEEQAEAYEAEGLTELAKSQRAQAETQRANAKVVKALAARLQTIGGYVESAKTRDADIARSAEQQAKDAVSEAIDNNPTLRYLDETYDSNPQSKELWDEIQAEDAVLKTLPRFARMSFDERFAAAIKRVEADRGPIKLPPEYQSVADIKRDAAQKAGRAGDFRPSTLSDLPGGGLPRDAADELSNMDPSQIERLLANASPDKVAELLARAG